MKMRFKKMTSNQNFKMYPNNYIENYSFMGSKVIELYTSGVCKLNTCNELYVNYTSIKLI